MWEGGGGVLKKSKKKARKKQQTKRANILLKVHCGIQGILGYFRNAFDAGSSTKNLSVFWNSFYVFIRYHVIHFLILILHCF